MAKIFVVGGGTGGHLFPAISVGQELLKRGHEVHLITDDRCIKYLDKHKGLFKFHIINSAGLNSGFVAKFLAIFKVFFALFETMTLFIKDRPDFVITFGGYISFAPLLCANFLLIPTAIHEQNGFLGKVNKWFATFSKRIFLTFENTKNIPINCTNKITISGNPVREEISSIKIKKDFKTNPFKIIVIGGSQGAKVFSEIVPKAIEIAMQKQQMNLEVIQQAREEDIKSTKEFYKKLGINSSISSFFFNIPEIISSSHLIIARSGASTIAELIHLESPAFFVPYPFAAQKHQNYNAEMIAKNSGGWWCDQKDVTPKIIASKIIETYNNRKILENASRNLRSLRMDSANIIANVLEKIIQSIKK